MPVKKDIDWPKGNRYGQGIIKKKPIEEKANCDKCGTFIKIKTLYGLSWRYNDKENTYRHSKVKIIHTGRFLLCKNCLNKLIIK